MHTALEQSQQKFSNCTKIKNNMKNLQGFSYKEKYRTKLLNRCIFCHNENRKKNQNQTTLKKTTQKISALLYYTWKETSKVYILITAKQSPTFKFKNIW